MKTNNKLLKITEKEMDKYNTIKNLIESRMVASEAAKILNLSVRQIKRIKKKVKEKGKEGIIHGNRGKRSNHRIKKEITDKIIKLKKNNIYQDFNLIHFQEKLKENRDWNLYFRRSLGLSLNSFQSFKDQLSLR